MISLYKFLFNISFLYSFLNLLTITVSEESVSVRGMVYLFAIYAGYLFVTRLNKQHHPKFQQFFKLLATAAFLVCLIFLPDSNARTFYVLAGIFLLIMLFSGRTEDDYASARKTYLWSTGFLVILTLGFLSVSLKAGETASAIVDGAFPFFLTMQISAFFLLRGTRERQHAKYNMAYKKFRIKEEVSLLILLFLSWSSHIYDSCRTYVERFYYSILQPALWAIGDFFGFLLYKFFSFFGQFIHATPEQLKKMMEDSLEKQKQNRLDSKDNLDLTKVQQAQSHFVQQFLMTIMVIVIIITLAIIIFRLIGRKAQEDMVDSAQEYREKVESTKKKHHLSSPVAPSDPALALRFYYLKYLKVLRHKKLKLTSSMTSEEIRLLADQSGKASEYDSTGIRKLYASHRYQSTTEVTKKDLQQMKAFLHKKD